MPVCSNRLVDDHSALAFLAIVELANFVSPFKVCQVIFPQKMVFRMIKFVFYLADFERTDGTSLFDRFTK